ncbi:dipeptidase [Natronosalvus rutilus]|uniref:Dipeptidase n=1 Tax=Natronosalvus rutilus TaxID=2953753 RepID=A0A9E7SY53_9EURY|nr:membrane dipeptidase [Natronosalvus rutilus]UTF55721.1 dipeptidase [Natronosalvus rutilus]
MFEESSATADEPFDLDDQQRSRAAKLHEVCEIIDGLVAGTYYLDDPEYRDRLRDADITAGNLTVGGPSFDYTDTIHSVTDTRTQIRENDDNYLLVESIDDIDVASESDRTGIVMGFQGANWVKNDLSRIVTMAELGVRVIDLTYNRGNTLGDGCCERRDAGLTMLGREAVGICNDQGIVLDVSHCNDETTMDVVSYSDDPVIASHIGCRALASSQGRAKTDEQLRAIADNGGVNCITPFPPVIKQNPETHKVQQATIADVLDHIDHAVDVGGVESVAFGGDMSDRTLDQGSISKGSNLNVWRETHPEVYGEGPTDRMDSYPEHLSRYTELSNLTHGLVDRGYSDNDVCGILGGNLRRVFEEVWK